MINSIAEVKEPSLLNKKHEDWEVFIHKGSVEELKGVSSKVVDSWKRSKSYGVNPLAQNPTVKLSKEELDNLLRRNKKLIEAANPFLELLSVAVKGSGFITTLTDKNGYVLAVMGDDDILEMARKNNYIPGCCRHERVVGTNAIGMAIEEKSPVQLVGADHYNVHQHNWTCSSCPIYFPPKNIIGVVTLSGNAINVHQHTLGMVVSAAKAIENKLIEAHLSNEKAELAKSLETIINSISEGLVQIDTDGIIINSNLVATKLLGLPSEKLRGMKIQSFLPRNKSNIRVRDLFKSRGKEGYIDTPLKTRKGVNSYIIRFSPIVEKEKLIGYILIFSESKKIFRFFQNITGNVAKFHFEDIIGENRELKQVIQLAKATSKTDSRVLILGESGSGKELFAHSIHNESHRNKYPFVAINCAAIPRDLLEAELFGYREGAFTGAKKGGFIGKFELADKGTIFLDEINNMPLDMQAKILRVIEDQKITRLGESEPRIIDVRVISASNKNLYEEVKRGNFREDLYFRLNVVEIRIPPLRERLDDIEILVQKILERIAKKHDIRIPPVSSPFMKALKHYYWPGNVRELENYLERALITCQDGVLKPKHLPSHVFENQYIPPASVKSKKKTKKSNSPLKTRMLQHVHQTLIACNGNISMASKRLGISRSTLYRYLKKKERLDNDEYVA